MNKLILIILLVFISQIGQSQGSDFDLYKLEYKVDSCGDVRLSSTLYIQHWGKLIDIDNNGICKCKLAHNINDSSDVRICNVKLAGVNIEKKSESIKKLRELLIGKDIKVNSAQSKSTSKTDFEGLIYLNNYLINYSLLVNGLATYRYEKYTLDFWTRCKFEEAQKINLNKN